YVRGRGIDEIVRAERSSGYDGTLNQVFFPIQDELGNVDRLTDAAGATLERYEYSGYGEFRIFSSSSAEQSFGAYGWRWLFQGREYDGMLGAYDFRARTLWPELGRFGQEDPEGTVDSSNLVQALLASWPDRTDPYGRKIFLTGSDPKSDFELFQRALENPVAAAKLDMRMIPGTNRPYIAYKTSRADFESAAIPDPADYQRRLAAQGIPKPLDMRTIEGKIASIISSPSVVVRYRTGSEFTQFGDVQKVYTKGGGVTVEPHETPSGNVEVVVDPANMVKWVFFQADTGGRGGYTLTYDPELVVMHEFGHALAYTQGKQQCFQVWAVYLENQVRARRDPRARLRIREMPNRIFAGKGKNYRDELRVPGCVAER
ncbi:MAG: RHS repeat domain-containing protein, partial [Thermoanaerobaculia bacterium]